MRSALSNRRAFLRRTAAATVPLIVPSSVWAKPPGSKLHHACIGTDGMGWSDLQSLASHDDIQIVAICDVDTARMNKAKERFPDARIYQDWRDLLAQEDDRIDSINVSVPDHMHAPICLSALQRGKHVYCQKPLTHDVAEARALRLAADQAGVVTQMGNQIQSHPYYRTAVDWIRRGAVGKVQAIHAWTNAEYTGQGRPVGQDPIPPSLAWDQWLGVAPARPYKSGVYHPFNWRRWLDFGTGAIGDFGCHILDTPFRALDLTAPISIRAEVPSEWTDNPARNRENWPEWEIIHYEFPATEFTTATSLPVTWYDSGKQPPHELFDFADASRTVPSGGALFVGQDGKLLLPHIGPPEFLAGSRFARDEWNEVAGFSHYHAFVDACLGRGETFSSFEYAGPLAEASLLGTIAVRRPGISLAWNASELRFTNDDGANALVSRSYRSGWQTAVSASGVGATR